VATSRYEIIQGGIAELGTLESVYEICTVPVSYPAAMIVRPCSLALLGLLHPGTFGDVVSKGPRITILEIGVIVLSPTA
jgi:hypothetical protein